ncbi:uncharacterized protein [Typha latifolia]|uniref:uncharacterized protein isoform X2 n=1 Tax=Typha latifolia TaxID=4733 RepID=UPI003C2AC07D
MDDKRLRQEKIQKFEDFVDRRLKPDLVKAIAERDKVFQQQKVFLDLKSNIEKLEKNGVTSLRSMVNLGSEVYMQADVYRYGFSRGVHLVGGTGVHISEGSKVGQTNRGVHTPYCKHQGSNQVGM